MRRWSSNKRIHTHTHFDFHFFFVDLFASPYRLRNFFFHHQPLQELLQLPRQRRADAEDLAVEVVETQLGTVQKEAVTGTWGGLVIMMAITHQYNITPSPYCYYH